MNQVETEPRVSILSIIGGLLVLLMAAAAGCDDSSVPTVQSTPSPGIASLMPTDTPIPAPADTPAQTDNPTRPPTVERSYPPPLWQPDHLVARTEEAAIAIHHIVMSRDRVTFIYSVELAQVDSDQTVMVLPNATLQAGGPDYAQAPTLAKVLYSGADVSLGAVSFGSFGLFDTGSLFFTLVVSELTVDRLSDGTKRTIDGPWIIPVIKRNSVTIRTSGFPRTSWDGRAHSDRRDVELRRDPGRYYTDTPIGRVATRGFFFLDRPVYFMVKPDGAVIEISEERYENFDEFLSNLERLPSPTSSSTKGAAAPLTTPTATPPPMPTVARDVLERPPQGPGAEIGKAYPYTLYIHCGVRDAHFDGRVWMADPMLGNYNPPPGWTSDDSRGTMELVRDDLAVFKSVSGRTIEFIPWPSDVEWGPCY